MRTTLDLPEPLFRRAKLAAVQRRLTLKDLVALALQRELDGPAPAARRMTAPPVPLATTPAAPALTNAQIAALLDKEDLAKSGR